MNQEYEGSHFGFFLESLRAKKSVSIDPRRLAKALAVSYSELAVILNVHRNLLSRPTSPKMQKALMPLIRCLSLAFKHCRGDMFATTVWLRNEPIPALRHKQGWNLIVEGNIELLTEWLEKQGA
jgi:hypothetical protein